MREKKMGKRKMKERKMKELTRSVFIFFSSIFLSLTLPSSANSRF